MSSPKVTASCLHVCRVQRSTCHPAAGLGHRIIFFHVQSVKFSQLACFSLLHSTFSSLKGSTMFLISKSKLAFCHRSATGSVSAFLQAAVFRQHYTSVICHQQPCKCPFVTQSDCGQYSLRAWAQVDTALFIDFRRSASPDLAQLVNVIGAIPQRILSRSLGPLALPLYPVFKLLILPNLAY